MKATLVVLVLATLLVSSCTLFVTTEEIADDGDVLDDDTDIEEEIIKEIDDIETELADDIDLDELDF